MEVAYIQVSGTQAIASRIQNIPAGIVGAVVRMSYADDPWCGLCKNVVFRHEGKSVTVMNAGKIVTVPPELIAAPSKEPVLVGVCGVDANNTVLIPTLWAKISPVFPSADLSGDPAADPSLPLWAQLQQADAQIIQKADNAKAAADNAKAAADNATAAANAASAAAGSAAQVAQAAQNTANQGVQNAAAAAQAAATADGKAQAAAAAAAAAQATADGAIQSPATAAVGQTIVVKSIDGNGKPTAWEAADFPPPVTDEHINELIYAALGPIEALVDEINGEVI